MDQLHEELKEPLTERDCDSSSDTEEKRDGDRSPSEDEFLSCDSGASSDKGEGENRSKCSYEKQIEMELLIQDECGKGISEKERQKDRKFSCGHHRLGLVDAIDEDADVDTSLSSGDAGGSGDARTTMVSNSPCRTPGVVFKDISLNLL